MNNYYRDGYTSWSMGDSHILEIIVVDGEKRTSIYHPTELDIQTICFDHGFDFDRVMDIVNQVKGKAHTLMFDAPLFRGDKEAIERELRKKLERLGMGPTAETEFLRLLIQPDVIDLTKSYIEAVERGK